MMWGYGFNTGWMSLLWILAVIALGLVAFMVIWAVTAGVRHDGSRGRAGGFSERPVRSTPRQILDERYAKGELTTEEYRERLAVLSEGE